MKIGVTVAGDLRGLMRRVDQNGQVAVTQAMKGVGALAKAAWKQQIATAGLGTRLSNTIQAVVYPENEPSMSAAALVYTKAPKIIEANITGPLIRARNGSWLAIPIGTGGKKKGGQRLTPAEWEERTGRKLKFVPQKGGRTALLVTEGGARLSNKGLAVPARRRRNARTGILSGETTIPVFVLVRQTKLPKRLDLNAVANEGASRLATLIVRGWRD